MTDGEFLAALEDCTLPESAFHHVDHVRAAYLYLRNGGFAEAIARLRRPRKGERAFFGYPNQRPAPSCES